MNNKETEALTCNQKVRGSSPFGGTIVFKGLAEIRWAFCFSGETLGKHYLNNIRVLSMQELRVR